MSTPTPRKSTGKTADKRDATASPTGTTTGADAMAAGSDANGAVKGYLGQDAADLRDDTDRAAELGLAVPAEVVPTSYEGAEPPAGHVADPTSKGHVGSDGTDGGKVTTEDPRPESAKGTTGTTADNAGDAAPGTQTGGTPPAQGAQQS